MFRQTLLVAAADAVLRRQIVNLLSPDYEVHVEQSPDGVLDQLQNRDVALLVIEANEHQQNAVVHLTDRVRNLDKRVPVVLVTQHPTMDLAIAALRAGIKDMLPCPLDSKALLETIKRHAATPPQDIRSIVTNRKPSQQEGTPLIGRSLVLQQTYDHLLRIAATDCSTLITGETGTGKELAASYVHKASSRSQFPLVPVNCAAIPEALLESEFFGHEKGAFTGANSSYQGKFRLANHGTLFLDEIGDLGAIAQAKLLRALETQEIWPVGANRSSAVDVRIIAATNHDLGELVKTGQFRADLYYRLNVAHVQLLPLRDRKEDIPLLVDHFIAECNRRLHRSIQGITPDALAALSNYDWPGNVRELRNVVEAAFITRDANRISVDDLPPMLRDFEHTGCTGPTECEILLSVLDAVNWNKSKAAERLHWSRMTLYRKIAKYGLEEPVLAIEAVDQHPGKSM